MLNGKTISRSWIFRSLVVVLMIAFFGCAAETKLQKIRPAEVSVGGIRTLAILKFDGKYGDTVRSDFYNKLAEVNHYNLIDTTLTNALDKVIYHQMIQDFCPTLKTCMQKSNYCTCHCQYR